MSDPTFGISITRIDNEPRPPVWSDMSVVGIIGTAPDADAAVFPANTPVFLYSDDAAKLTALGDAGTLKDALVLLNAQLGEFQVAAKVVLVRVEDGVDTSATIANVVGDGALTGLSAFLRAGPEIGMIPRLLCAPGFTSQRTGAEANPVCAALPPICEKLLAHAVVDGPATSEQDAIDWRETISSSRLIPIDPAVKVYAEGVSVVQPASPAIIGIGVRRDHEKQGRPFHSWANQPVQGIVGPSRPINFSLTDGATEGQRLLSANIGVLLRGEMGVESAIGQGGFIFVGTDNAGEDDLWRFYNVTRGRDFIHLMLLRTLRFYLGRFNVTGQTIQAILNTMETGLRNLKADGDILGFELKFTRDQNTPEELRQGRFTVSFAAEEAPVLRYLGIQSARYRPALDALLDDLLAQVGTITGWPSMPAWLGGGAEAPAVAVDEFSGVDGTRASGGPISRGGTYLVGERGPELITANRNGYGNLVGLLVEAIKDLEREVTQLKRKLP